MNTAVPQQEHSTASDLTASVEVLTLPEGIYAFTVRGGAVSEGTSNGLILPALQVTAAPAKSAGTVEFLAGPGTYDRWLARSGDVVTAKISGGSASLLLTSVRSRNSSILAIDARKLDVKNDSTADTVPSADPPSASLEARSANDPAARQLPLRVLVHVQNLGDLQFTESWAGRADERLWIEAFTVTCLEPNATDLIQYRGVTADGFATPWLSNELLCGSRGRGMPLTAFAIRVKPGMVDRYACVYRGKFASGIIAGPFDDARLCRSDTADDALVGIEISVVRREAATEASAA